MLLLIFISFIGFVLSAVIHLCSLFRIYESPREIKILIQIGIIAVFYPSWFISEKMRKEENITDYKKAILGVCPKWMLILNSFLLVYAFAGLLYSLFIKQIIGAANKDFRGFSGHWMALYFLTFTILYCCKRLRNGKSNLPG